LHRVTKDGKSVEQMLVQNERNSLLEASEPEHGENIDVSMDMMWDWNHAIVLKTKDNDKGLHLIPSMALSEMIIMHESCENCWSMNNAKWSPDWKEPVGGENVAFTPKKFSYVHMLHVYDCKAEGHYWRMNACLDSD